MNTEFLQNSNELEERTLTEYWLVLTRRWRVVVFIFIATLVGGIVYAKTRPPLPFPHITTIEIGRLADGAPIEGMQAVESKIREAYIPAAFQKHANQNNYDQKRYTIELDVPKDGDTLLLKSYGSENTTETLLSLQREVADLLIRDHAQKTEWAKNEIKQQQSVAELTLDDLKEQGRLIPRRRQIIEETAQLLKRQIDTVAILINTAERDRAAALASAVEKGSVDQSLTTAILLMNTTIAENREKLRDLEERYYITTQNERTNIDRAELENKRQQKDQEQSIKNAEFRMNNLQETKIIFPPARLLRNTPKGPMQTVVFFGIAGLCFGIFAAGFVEFASNARKYGRTVRRD